MPNTSTSRLTLLCLAFIVAGCASGRVARVSDAQAEGPRVVALSAPSAPWVIEIQSRLKQKGFKVLRWSSRAVVTERTGADKVETYAQAEARYVLQVDGSTPYDWARRCVGGGYNFDHITADLIDIATNETIMNISGSGYSENCPPMSGTIFSDIAEAVESAWITPPNPQQGAKGVVDEPH